ncbi:hypothetical protein ACFQGS_23575 [Novosphingobium lubricantis]
MPDVLALPWLLPAPADFRRRLKALRSVDAPAAADLIALASYGLDLSALSSLGKLAAAQRDALIASGRLRSVKLGIAATHTADLIADVLPATGLRHSLQVQTLQTDYGQIAQQVLDPASALAQWNPDFVFLALDAAALGLARPQFDAGDAEPSVPRSIMLHPCAMACGQMSVRWPYSTHWPRRLTVCLAATITAFRDRRAG